MSCPSCITTLSGVDGFDGFDPAPGKGTAIGAVIGGIAGYFADPRHRAVGAVLGATAGYLIAAALAS
ncbi:MAG: hypothetical protein WCI74_21490, partial [Actinomycetes bacterium]